jgi:Tfp pilus assembly protein PilN
MLKINLLPPYINQAGKIRTAWTMMAVLLVVELAGLTFYQKTQIDTEQQKITEVTEAEQHVTRVEKLKQDADKERAKIAPIKEKTDFINQLFTYNRVRPDLYEHVASYVYNEVWISGMQAEQNTLTMPASAKSISSVGRFLLFMQNNPDFTQVRISSVPGWPPGTAGVEAGPIGGPGGGPGPGGSGGPPGGSSGPPGGAGPGMMPGGSGGPPGGSSGPPGGGELPGGGPPIFGGGAAPGGPGLMSVPSPGAGTDIVTAGGAPIPYNPAVDLPKPRPAYFQFTVTGILAKPITRPSYQGVGAEGDTGVGGPPGGSPYGSGGPVGSGGPPYGSGGPVGSGGPPYGSSMPGPK